MKKVAVEVDGARFELQETGGDDCNLCGLQQYCDAHNFTHLCEAFGAPKGIFTRLITSEVKIQLPSVSVKDYDPLMTASDGEIIFLKPNEQTKPSEWRQKIVDCYKCNECGRQLMFSKGISHIVCPACGSENLERTTMGEMLNKTITANLEDEDK
jgi:DNA-directed RNA polymerase subunit RPC12/RpoP